MKGLNLIICFLGSLFVDAESQSVLLGDFTLDPVVAVSLPAEGIFLSCLNPLNEEVSTDLHCVYRVQGYGPHFEFIRRLVLDGITFKVKTPLLRRPVREDRDLVGSDPRIFLWNNEVYVLNNYSVRDKDPYETDGFMFVGTPSLYRLARSNDGLQHVEEYLLGNIAPYILRNSQGPKNKTPVPINSTHLLLVDFQDELATICVHRHYSTGHRMFRLGCATQPSNFTYFTDDRQNSISDWHHRGGTSGVQIAPGVYAGFGHATNKGNLDEHDIYFWTLQLSDDTMNRAIFSIRHFMTDHEADLSLTDPASIFKVQGKWYLTTAESTKRWTTGVSLINQVYEIKPNLDF